MKWSEQIIYLVVFIVPGVYLCRHAELITRLCPALNDSGYLVVFKVLKVRFTANLIVCSD